MCFSATASFAAGTALTAAGVITIKQTKKKSELPFASIPLFFGIQQLIEGVVWITYSKPILNTLANYSYAFIAQVWWPMFIPIAVLLLEKSPARRKVLYPFVMMGILVGLYLFYFIVTEPVTSRIVGDSICYQTPNWELVPMLIFYLLATCGSCLVSSYSLIRLLGFLLFSSAAIAQYFYYNSFLSVWCFFSALLSIIVYWFFRSRTKADKDVANSIDK
jgi:hypothetical protein